MLGRENLRRLTRSSAIVTGATALTFACSLAALAVNTRALGAAQFGVLAVVQAYFAFISGAATFDNWQPVVRLGLRSPKNLGLIIGSAIALDLGASAVAAITATIGVLAFGRSVGVDENLGVALWVYCASLLAGVGGTPKGYFRLQSRYDILALNQLSYGVLQFVASVLLWRFGGSLSHYLFVFAIFNALPSLSIFVRMLLMVRTSGSAIRNPFARPSRRRYFRHVLHFAGGNSVLSTLTTSRHQIALFIVSSVTGSAAAGLFAVAVRCANAFTRFVAPLNQVLFPEILKMVDEREPAVVRRSMRRAALGLVVFCIAVGALGAVSSRALVSFAAGPEFAGAARIFACLLVAEIALWFGYYFNPIVLHTVGQGQLVKANTILMAVTYLAALAAAGQFGAVGVGAALLASATCTCLVMYLMAEIGIGRAVDKQLKRTVNV